MSGAELCRGSLPPSSHRALTFHMVPNALGARGLLSAQGCLCLRKPSSRSLYPRGGKLWDRARASWSPPGVYHLQGLQVVDERAQGDENKTNYIFESQDVCNITKEVSERKDAVKVCFTWLGSLTLLLKIIPTLQSYIQEKTPLQRGSLTTTAPAALGLVLRATTLSCCPFTCWPRHRQTVFFGLSSFVYLWYF